METTGRGQVPVNQAFLSSQPGCQAGFKGPCTQIDILWPYSSPYLGTLGPKYIYLATWTLRVGFVACTLPGSRPSGFNVWASIDRRVYARSSSIKSKHRSSRLL